MSSSRGYKLIESTSLGGFSEQNLLTDRAVKQTLQQELKQQLDTQCKQRVKGLRTEMIEGRYMRRVMDADLKDSVTNEQKTRRIKLRQNKENQIKLTQ